MSDLRELYQEMILDHGRSPRNFGPLSGANRSATGNNPLCGDRIALHLCVEDGVVTDASFEGVGCAISVASASLMTEMLKGKSEVEVQELFSRFHNLVARDGTSPGDDTEGLEKLTVFSGVREFPMRVKCATLAWHTMNAALGQRGEEVTTE